MIHAKSSLFYWAYVCVLFLYVWCFCLELSSRVCGILLYNAKTNISILFSLYVYYHQSFPFPLVLQSLFLQLIHQKCHLFRCLASADSSFRKFPEWEEENMELFFFFTLNSTSRLYRIKQNFALEKCTLKFSSLFLFLHAHAHTGSFHCECKR